MFIDVVTENGVGVVINSKNITYFSSGNSGYRVEFSSKSCLYISEESYKRLLGILYKL